MNQMSYAEKRTCSVCGSLITDGNRDGIGIECRYSYKKARGSVFFDTKERTYSFYSIGAKKIMPLFIKEFKDTKFRSKFKKSFYPSIVEQYKTKGYLSSKQLDICENWLYKQLGDEWLSDTQQEIKREQAKLISDWEPNEEEKAKIFNYANKLRHEFRGKQ